MKFKYSSILENVNPNWTVKEKAKFVYESICKVSTYDERFEYERNPYRLRKIYNRTIDVDKEEDTRIVCNSVHKVYKELLNRLGIRAELIERPNTDEKRPDDIKNVALVFYDEEGKKYYTNITGDLENCRYGMRTEYFGITKNLFKDAQDVTLISTEENEEIDATIGYVKEKRYSNVLFDLLVDEVKNTNNFKNFLITQGFKDVKSLNRDQIMSLKMHFLSLLIKYREKNAGPSEIKAFYKRLFNTATFDKFETKKIKAYQFSKESEDDEDSMEVMQIIELNMDEGPIYYIFSKEEDTYVLIPNQDLIQKRQGFIEKFGRKMAIERTDEDREL